MSKCYDNPDYDDLGSDIQNAWEQHKPEQHVEFINDNIEEFDKAIKLFKQETTLEEAIERLFIHYPESSGYIKAALIGKEWQMKRSYIEEEVIGFLADRERDLQLYDMTNDYEDTFKWFEQFKKK